MKSFASLCALLLAGSVPGLAAAHHVSVNPQNQFHFKPAGPRAASAHIPTNNHLRGLAKLQSREPKIEGSVAQPHSASAKNVRRHTANPPTGKLGFVSALEIPTGGESYYPALPADLNGDGNMDVLTEVENYDTTNGWTYSLSAVLSNGDGTFQQAVLTNVPLNDGCAEFVVGDLNSDKKADVIVAHQPGCDNSYTVPTFDVLLGNGDGTFKLVTTNTNNSVNTSWLAGGTLADVNGDGKLDIIVVDQNSPASVWTLLGNGDGTFQAPTSVALSGQAGYNVLIADLNGDGLLDIAYNDSSSDQVSVYLAASTTSYAPAAAYATSDHTYNVCSLTAGDLNGDGKPELVTANCSDSGNDVTVYLNNGDGTFQTGVYYNSAMSGGTNSDPAEVDTYSVTVADVNGDGKADVIASNEYSSDITVLLGNGDGTVKIPTVGYAIGGYYPWAPAIVADFNGDGLADVIVPDDEFSLVYMKGYGDGTFRSSLNSYVAATASTYSYGIASGDFNGDGQPDFVLGGGCNGCASPTGITVFLSRPDGSLQPGVNYASSSTMFFVAVADFNGDGKLDIAATDTNAGVVQIFNGDGTGNFTVGSSFSTDLASNQPYGLVVGDFNKDGHPDLAIANYNGLDVAILLNDGSGNFPTPVPVTLNNYSWEGLAVADINGDGNLDLVLPAYNGSSVAVLLGNGDGTFQAEQDVALGGYDPQAVVLADLNGDGKPDMAVTLDQGGGQDIAIALGNGDGTFGSFSIVPSSLQNYNLETPDPQYIQAVDVDGDGKTDLVYANSYYGTIGVLFGQGNGTFYDPVEYPVGGYPWSITLADVNGDGAPDVVTANDEFAGTTVLLNANGTATQPNFTITSPQSSATVTAGTGATYSLVVTPSNLYNGTISFSCGSLPSEATCAFQPATLAPNGNGQWSTQVTISTTAATSAALHHTSSPMMLATFSGIGLFGLVFAGSFKKNRMGLVIAMLAFVMMISLVGCSGSGNNNNNNNGGGNPGTPAGSYTVVVTATGTSGSTNVSHTFNLNLTVQ